MCFQPHLKPSYLCPLLPSPSSKEILGVPSRVPCTALGSSTVGREVFQAFLRYNCYFGAQTSAGKGNISAFIISASFPRFLRVQISLLTVAGGSEAPPVQPPSLSPCFTHRPLAARTALLRDLQLNIHLCSCLGVDAAPG